MNNNDLSLYVGGDLAASATGDLQTVSTQKRGEQRVLRRLLTNAGEYIFHTDYGAGLPREVGKVTDIAKIKAKILSQLLLDEAVAQRPAPVITVRTIAGGLSVAIQYTDANTLQIASLSFNVNG
jgi:hypothetical protein